VAYGPSVESARVGLMNECFEATCLDSNESIDFQLDNLSFQFNDERFKEY